MNTLYRFSIAIVGISLVVGPIASWAAKGPCVYQAPAAMSESNWGCVNGAYSGEFILYEYRWVCKNENEENCNPSNSTQIIYHLHIASTTQTPEQQQERQREYDAIANAYAACNAVAGSATVGTAWFFSWAGFGLGSIVAGGVVGVVGGVTCNVVYNQKMSAHNNKVNNCFFVRPKLSP